MLLDDLNGLLQGRLAFHMPGHKRNTALAPYLQRLAADQDVTEIAGTDNLQHPEGLLRDSMRLACDLYGAKAAYLLVNGSTGGILAGMRALTQPGKQVLMQRDSHQSVYHGAELCNLRPAYLPLRLDGRLGCPLPPTVDDVRTALESRDDIGLLVLTSPSYTGHLADLPALVGLARELGIPVLVDAAHGAHLGLHSAFPQGAVSSGADIVVTSLHKTLPSLTQTALAFAADEGIGARLQAQLNVFQSSSPSYLLLAAIDACLHLLKERGEELLPEWRRNLEAFSGRMAALEHLRLVPSVGRDPSKLLIDCGGCDMTGYQLLQRLGEQGIDLEMAAPCYALAMSGLGDTSEAFDQLAEALLAIDPGLQPVERKAIVQPTFPELVDSPVNAMAGEYEVLPLREAVGRICAEYVIAYPPGCPLLVPGEQIDEASIVALRTSGDLIKARSGREAGRVAVMK